MQADHSSHHTSPDPIERNRNPKIFGVLINIRKFFIQIGECILYCIVLYCLVLSVQSAGWYRSSTTRFCTVSIQHDRLRTRILEHRIDWTRHDSAPSRLCTNQLFKNDWAPARLCTNRLCKNDWAPARLCTNRLCKTDSVPAQLCTNRPCKNEHQLDCAPLQLCTSDDPFC